MKIIISKNIMDFSVSDLVHLLERYKKVEIDLGTGDGFYVYKKALENSATLYIGIDPSQSQLKIYSSKARRYKLENVLFVVASVEVLPNELKNCANTLNIILPWGTLLSSVVKADSKILKNIVELLAPNGRLKIIFGYTKETEPSETKRLELEDIDSFYITDVVVSAFAQLGMELITLKTLEKSDLKNFQTTWSKKLRFGKDRPLFYLELIKQKAQN